MTTETEIGMMPLQGEEGRDCWQPPAAGRGKEGSSPRSFREPGSASGLMCFKLYASCWDPE